VAAVLVWVGGLLVQSITVAAARGGGNAAGDLHLIAAVRFWDRRITLPALILVWVLGITMATQGGWFRSGWLQAKLVLVILLSGVHGVQAGMLRRQAASGVSAGNLTLGWMPVVAALAVSAIALLAVAKPF
jgi:uncharacterized membrane protein